MSAHPVNDFSATSMQKIKEMIDVNTVVGQPIVVSSEITIIPVSKVAFGFASGGSDLPSKAAPAKDLFGAGAGAGVTVTPIAFLVVNGSSVRIMYLSAPSNTGDKVVDMVPGVLDKVTDIVSQFTAGKKEKSAPKEDDTASDDGEE